MTKWIEWNGGDCPIKSDKTMVEYKLADGYSAIRLGRKIGWGGPDGTNSDIIAYRITDDHEPKMAREQITAQIAELQKQLDAIPVVSRRYYGTYYIDIETINGVPHIHGVAMKECGK